MIALVVGALAALTTTNVGLSELGYPRGIALFGSRPTVALRFPIYPGLERVSFSLPVTFTPLDDPRSTIDVRIGSRVVAHATVGALHGEPLRVSVPVTKEMGESVDLTVAADFRDLDASCHAIDPVHLGARLTPPGSVGFVQQAGAAASSLATYAGSYAVVVPPVAPDSASDRAIALAYQLHRLVDWRHVNVIETPQDAADRRNVDPATANTGAPLPAPATQRTATVASLGALNLKQSGVGALTFSIPFTLAPFGGNPRGLVFTALLHSSPLFPGDRASLSALLNGVEINRFGLSHKGGAQRFQIPIDTNRLLGFNTLSLVLHYVPANVTCAHDPHLDATLDPQSAFRWRDSSRGDLTVSEFLGMLSGRVAVLVDPTMRSAAFDVMNLLGSVSGNVRSLDVLAYAGSIPAGYDYVIVVAPEDAPVTLPADTVFFATEPGSTPRLDVSVVGDPNVFRALRGVETSGLIASMDTVIAVDRVGTVLHVTNARVLRRPTGASPARTTAIIVVFVALLLIVLTLVARSARRYS